MDGKDDGVFSVASKEDVLKSILRTYADGREVTVIRNDFGMDDNTTNHSKLFVASDKEAASLQLFSIASPPTHYRHRCRFQLLHETQEKSGGDEDVVCFGVWEKGEPKALHSPADFPIASEQIQKLMGCVLNTFNHHSNHNNHSNDHTTTNSKTKQAGLHKDTIASDTSKQPTVNVLKKNCEAVHFQTTTTGDCLIVLIYSQPIDDEAEWRASAEDCSRLWVCNNIIGRCKGKKFGIGNAFVRETLQPRGHVGKIILEQPEGAFSNPNPYICERTMEWIVFVLSQARSEHHQGVVESSKQEEVEDSTREIEEPIQQHPKGLLSVLELYSGAGTYTPLIAQHADHVTSIEINPSLVTAARRNLEVNGVLSSTLSVNVVEAPVEKCKHILQRASNNGVKFNCVVLDPPRGGMDAFTRSCLHQYEHIILLSCAPHNTYPVDLPALLPSHKVVSAALLDHFPMTAHMEAGLYLHRRSKT
eukprot:m.1243 g.1243  ORF g.1243 m.1243 type:complete len:475 (-) comp1251_c0_seq1:57-1481(-)